MKIKVNGLLVKIVLAVFILVLLWQGARIYGINQARQARFNIEVLGRFINAYHRAEGKWVERLKDMPDFHIISTADSLSLRSADLKRGPILDGYVYDMQTIEPGKYVISASPIGFLAPGIEYAITENGQVKYHKADVDSSADSYEEISSWPVDEHMERIRTAQLPPYLQN